MSSSGIWAQATTTSASTFDTVCVVNVPCGADDVDAQGRLRALFITFGGIARIVIHRPPRIRRRQTSTTVPSKLGLRPGDIVSLLRRLGWVVRAGTLHEPRASGKEGNEATATAVVLITFDSSSDAAEAASNLDGALYQGFELVVVGVAPIPTAGGGAAGVDE